ncbi:MAG: T9SS type A sorting domain-containing protein [Candidatus Aegiribacteria sp.]|nr:T9SS type A sorting domain-containing protein [Candidatus Aegiribacteria sp.]
MFRIMTLLSGFLLIAGSFSPVNAGIDVWTSSGPLWGNSLIVEVNPANTDIVYGIGADRASGLFISEDGAQSWKLSNEGLGLYTPNPVSGSMQRMSAYAIDPLNPDNHYCAMTDDHFSSGDLDDFVFRSEDGGNSWARVLETFGPMAVNYNCIAAYDGHVYVGGKHDLEEYSYVYYSGDGGSTWERRYGFTVGEMNAVVSLAVNPDNPYEVYCSNVNWGGSNSGLYKSTDGGISFNYIDYFGRHYLSYVGVHKTGTQRYITVSRYNNGFYISTDDGQNWHKRDNGLPDSFTLQVPNDVAFSPNSPGTIYAAVSEGVIYKTDDEGLNWYSSTFDMECPYTVGLEYFNGVSVACFDDNGNDIVYIASDIGLHKSEDAAASWNLAGIPCSTIKNIEFQGSDPYSGYAGSYNGLFKYDGTNWDETSFMAQIGNVINSTAINPDDPQTVLIGNQNGFGSPQIWKSTDGGENWVKIFDHFSQGIILDLVYKPDDPLKVFAVISMFPNSGGLLVSTDGADSFNEDSYFADTPLFDIAIAPSNPDLLYVCSHTGDFWVSEDGGSSWIEKANIGFSGEIAVDPDNPLRVYIGGNSDFEALRVSDDGGDNWYDGGFGGGDIRGIEFADDKVVIGSYGEGVFYGNVGDSWISLSEDLLNPLVQDIWAYDNGVDVTVYAATYGAAVFHIELSELGISTEEEDQNSTNPTGFALYQPRPNPITANAAIAFSLPETARVDLSIYDIAGRKVVTLVDETLTAGAYERVVSGLSAGVHFCRLQAGSYATVRKIIVVQ